MACPAADFVEESFLLTVKDTLSEQGLFIVNLVSRSPAVKDTIISRMKAVRKILLFHSLKNIFVSMS
jgi:spermidine synthase